MAKTPKLPKKEEEYRFAEIEQEPLEEEVESPKTSRFKTLFANRRIWLILGVIIAIFVVYQFIGKSPKVKEEVGEFEGKPTVATINPLEQAATTPAIPSSAVAVPTITGQQQQPQTELDTVASQTQQNQLQLQQIQTNLKQLQGSVAQLSGQVSGLNNGSTVGASTQACAVPRRVIQTVAVTTVVQRKFMPPRPFYSVRAVVPGRAWLQEKKNRLIVHLITVKVGDFLPGYGRIQAISSRRGMVWTSWGNVIKYDDGVTS